MTSLIAVFVFLALGLWVGFVVGYHFGLRNGVRAGYQFGMKNKHKKWMR